MKSHSPFPRGSLFLSVLRTPGGSPASLNHALVALSLDESTLGTSIDFLFYLVSLMVYVLFSSSLSPITQLTRYSAPSFSLISITFLSPVFFSLFPHTQPITVWPTHRYPSTTSSPPSSFSSFLQCLLHICVLETFTVCLWFSLVPLS